MTGPPRIRVSIDRLVLHGVDPAEAAAVRRALSHELQTLLADADAGALAGAGERARMRLNIGPAGDTAALARGAARAVSGALGIAGRRGRP